MNKQEINKSRQECISSVKDLCGKNCAYFSPDKTIYYSPNRTVHNSKKIHAIESNLPDLYRSMKQFKNENPNEKVRIVKV
jgi:hypothetical protein